jgi:hypothetical protein
MRCKRFHPAACSPAPEPSSPAAKPSSGTASNVRHALDHRRRRRHAPLPAGRPIRGPDLERTAQPDTSHLTSRTRQTNLVTYKMDPHPRAWPQGGNVGTRRYRARVDIELILDSAEIVSPGLTDTARRILAATARDMDPSLELADVLACQAEAWPDVHITAAADEIVKHLGRRARCPRRGGRLHDAGTCRAQMLMSRTEMDGGSAAARILTGRRAPAG